ncbi:MAG: hypothetical protein OEV40_06350 [Acidimicrobiia bacterium]|nr:hypothetical protein [Acidimicrobiia bacterium]
MTLSEGALTPDRQRQLGQILWAYGDQLRRVEVLLEAHIVFASSGREGHLGVLADLLAETAATIGELDLRREVLLAPSAGGPPPTLSELVATSDDAWAAILADHQRSLASAVQRIQYLLDQNRHTMVATLELLGRMATDLVDVPVTGYDRSGRTVRPASSAVLFDGQA